MNVFPKMYLVRHDETVWTMSKQHTGHTDNALTLRGERNAQALRTRLQSLTFGVVLTSPRQRAQRTGELAGFIARMHPDPDLVEWDYGAYEGWCSSGIRAERPGWNLFADGCSGRETLVDVSTRAGRVMGRVHAIKGDVLVCVHMEIFRILAARWVGLAAPGSRHLYLENTSASILGYEQDLDEPVIRLCNDA